MDAVEKMKSLAGGKKCKFKILKSNYYRELEETLNKLNEEINIVDVNIAGDHNSLYCVVRYTE